MYVHIIEFSIFRVVGFISQSDSPLGRGVVAGFGIGVGSGSDTAAADAALADWKIVEYPLGCQTRILFELEPWMHWAVRDSCPRERDYPWDHLPLVCIRYPEN